MRHLAIAAPELVALVLAADKEARDETALTIDGLRSDNRALQRQNDELRQRINELEEAQSV